MVDVLNHAQSSVELVNLFWLWIREHVLTDTFSSCSHQKKSKGKKGERNQKGNSSRDDGGEPFINIHVSTVFTCVCSDCGFLLWRSHFLFPPLVSVWCWDVSLYKTTLDFKGSDVTAETASTSSTLWTLVFYWCNVVKWGPDARANIKEPPGQDVSAPESRTWTHHKLTANGQLLHE